MSLSSQCGKLGQQTPAHRHKHWMVVKMITFIGFVYYTAARCSLGRLRCVPTLPSLLHTPMSLCAECPCCATCRFRQEPSAGWRHVGLVYPSRAAGWRGRRHRVHLSEAAGAADRVGGGDGSWPLGYQSEEQHRGCLGKFVPTSTLPLFASFTFMSQSLIVCTLNHCDSQLRGLNLGTTNWRFDC